MSPKLAAVLLTLAASSLAGAAEAHAYLESAAPAVDGMSAPPAEIRITFSEEVVTKFSGLTLKNGAGKKVAVGKPKAGADKSVLIVPVKAKLAPGPYDVEWFCVSADTHRMKGHYRFTVR
ncbi:copper homeostasis periplasmic binding protein CopC [Phenylobacterium sp.]|uniref:copper homeostasis periplasmic binding protein CopC n=1 Tax=Phenylobacterium sp. TaxID=1871053 RepID=UPI002732D74E|nr:copper homeostasis periplasmic binding protein CopC [Phenylobacterium sp.]MDP3660504.1 copper homeostasis periplasmic binding protein CopC [Phenylobacterium sp.]